MVQVGIIMPCRLRHLRIQEGRTLSDAVQALTGLDRISELGDFAADLCNGNLEFRRYARRENQAAHKEAFDRHVQAAEKRLPPNTLNFDRLRDLKSAQLPSDLKDAKDALAHTAAIHLRTLAEDMALPATVDQQAQKTISAAVELARADVAAGLSGVPVVQALEASAAALRDGSLDIFQKSIESLEDDLTEARRWHGLQQTDSRLRLKALAARWHREQHPEAPDVTTCPLCGQGLGDFPALAAELTALREQTELAEQTFSQACVAFESRFRRAWPANIDFDPDRWQSLEPRAAILAGLRERFVSNDRYSRLLTGLSRTVSEYLTSVESALPEASAPQNADQDSPERGVLLCIRGGRRLGELARWWTANGANFALAWRHLVNDSGAGHEKSPRCLQSCLGRCSDALALSEPFQDSAASLDGAITAANAWSAIEAEQNARDEIAAAISPLKDLRAYIQHQTQIAINLLSSQIGETLDRIYLTDALRYENTTINKQLVSVHGSFNSRYKLNAALVANTSWLRAFLWAFVFAVRKETVTRLQHNPLPLLVLDDPQTTFDPQHKRKWAQLIATLQNLPASDLSHGQFLIATHDVSFVDNLKVEAFSGRMGTMCGVNTAAGGVATILDGERLERLWKTADLERTPQAAQDFIKEVRTEVEIRLRLMLRGEGPDIASLIWAKLRDRLESLHSARVPPYDRPIFKALVGLISSSIKEVNLINWPHHFRGDDVAYAQAVDVELFWRKKLQGPLVQAFEMQREYAAVYGDRLFLMSPSESIDLPAGHEDILRNAPFVVRGRAAAMTGGRVADGRISVEEYAGGEPTPSRLCTHALYQLTAPTLEPVASAGDVLIVSHAATVNVKNLVVVAVGDQIVARRFDVSDANPELAILSAQAVSPYDIAAPVAVLRSCITPKKVVGVLYKIGQKTADVGGPEVTAMASEALVRSLLREVHGLYRVDGRSAEPYALHGQYLIVGSPSSDPGRLTQSDGSMVLAIDEDGGQYFKRLRVADSSTVILESLDLSGREPSVLLATKPGARTALTEVVPILGVLFELPA